MTFRGNHVDELISASLTGELTDKERLELDAHLVRCETCRATLAAFTAERRILSGLPLADPPRDLSARVRSGIESGRGRPWWQRSSSLIAFGATLATAAAAVLVVVVLGNLNFSPVGQSSNSPLASGSLLPGPSAVATSPATEQPTPVPAFALGPGELGYLSLSGASLEPSRLTFNNDATGASLDLGTVAGPPIAASLSPNGQWLAYITQKGESGANEVWALHLADGTVQSLGCSSSAPFTDRLAWSPDSSYLAYTLVGIDLGPSAGCQDPTDGSDVWLLDTSTGRHSRFTSTGNAYAASFFPFRVPDAANRLWISYAAGTPSSDLVAVPSLEETLGTAAGVFLPLMSPDGNRALFWSGTMTNNGGSWHFSQGGMPQLSGDFRSAGPASPWATSMQLFTDLTPVSGEAFSSGTFAWGPDSDLIGFWDGAWTGVPQSADGLYPSQQDVYVGRVSGGLLSQASLVERIEAPEGAWVVAAVFAADGSTLALSIGLPSAGIGDPPSANLEIIPFAELPLPSGAVRTIGGGVDPPPWNGPAVYGY
jgi:anti-sigma factor RsiW